MYDQNGVEIKEGDYLRHEDGYDVRVFRNAAGNLSGELMCEDDHSCRGIPYALNKGKGYVHIQQSEVELAQNWMDS